MAIIRTEFLNVRDIAVIGAFSVVALWIAARYLPHPATQPLAVSPGAGPQTDGVEGSGDFFEGQDYNALDLGAATGAIR